MATVNQPPGGIAEYTTTTGTGPYELRGALPRYDALASQATDRKSLKYRATDGVRQEVGLGWYDGVNNQIIRSKVIIPRSGLVAWGPGRKFIYVELSDDSIIDSSRLSGDYPGITGTGGTGSPGGGGAGETVWALMPLVSGLTPGPDLVADGFGQCIGVPVKWTP